MKDLFGRETAGAVFDKSRVYRYDLWRLWDETKPMILWVMLNPSTADEYKLDPTVTRCKSFSIKWGYGSFHVANIFALRATDPKELQKHENPVGSDNNKWIDKLSARADRVMVAWGADKMVRETMRYVNVLEIILKHKKPYCLGKTKEGYPRHPLYVSSGQAPELFEFGQGEE